jgi:hypothetical protein
VLQTIFIGLQLAVLAAAAVFGWSQLREAKELREEQTRPFVVIDLDSARPKSFDLVVKNIGATMARDVKFKFDPPPESTIQEASLDRLKMFRDGISTLPPRKEIRTLFDTGPARHDAGLPDVYEVTVTYQGQAGTKRYEEKIDLDFGLYWNRMYMTVRDVHDLHRELETIRKEVQKWTASFGGGILRVTPDDVEKRVKEIERDLEDRRREEGDA